MSLSKLKQWRDYCNNCTMVFIEFILMDNVHLYFISVLILDTFFLHLGQFKKVGAQYEVELCLKPISHAICETHKISIPGPW